MEKQEIKFALVCVNEEKEVLSVQGFANKEDAYAQMKTEFENEKDSIGDNDNIEWAKIEDNCAHIYCNDDYEYHWSINKIII